MERVGGEGAGWHGQSRASAGGQSSAAAAGPSAHWPAGGRDAAQRRCTGGWAAGGCRHCHRQSARVWDGRAARPPPPPAKTAARLPRPPLPPCREGWCGWVPRRRPPLRPLGKDAPRGDTAVTAPATTVRQPTSTAPRIPRRVPPLTSDEGVVTTNQAVQYSTPTPTDAFSKKDVLQLAVHSTPGYSK